MENLEMNFWRDRKVFVTGASGLLGSSMVEELVARGANVTCLVRDWVHGSKLLESDYLHGCNIVRGELTDYGLVLRAVNEYEINTVMHLGAQAIAGTAARSPISTFESNIQGSWNVLEACRQCPGLIERVIVASSDKAYGCHEDLPYTEDTPLVGRYPYDVSKSCTDLITKSYFHTYGVPIAITRCGNLFGEGDLNFNRLVPGTIVSALRNEPPVIRSDGRFIRDYFYVRDAVDAYLQLAEKLPGESVVGEDFNFGAENPMSVVQMVETILELMGKSHLEPMILNESSHEIREQTLDCGKARKVLGWEPERSLTDGLLDTIAWYRDRVRIDG
jgi:CDP-glucose 4,6-dehydratase